MRNFALSFVVFVKLFDFLKLFNIEDGKIIPVVVAASAAGLVVRREGFLVVHG